MLTVKFIHAVGISRQFHTYQHINVVCTTALTFSNEYWPNYFNRSRYAYVSINDICLLRDFHDDIRRGMKAKC